MSIVAHTTTRTRTIVQVLLHVRLGKGAPYKVVTNTWWLTRV